MMHHIMLRISSTLSLLCGCCVFRVADTTKHKIITLNAITSDSLTNPAKFYSIHNYTVPLVVVPARNLNQLLEWELLQTNDRRSTLRKLLHLSYKESRSMNNIHELASHLARDAPNIVFFLIDLLSRPDVFGNVLAWEVVVSGQLPSCFRVSNWIKLQDMYTSFPRNPTINQWAFQLRDAIARETHESDQKISACTNDENRYCVINKHNGNANWYIHFRQQYPLQFDCDKAGNLHMYHIASQGRLLDIDAHKASSSAHEASSSEASSSEASSSEALSSRASSSEASSSEASSSAKFMATNSMSVPTTVMGAQNNAYAAKIEPLIRVVPLQNIPHTSYWREWELSQPHHKYILLAELFQRKHKFANSEVKDFKCLMHDTVLLHLIHERPDIYLLILDLQSRRDVFGNVVEILQDDCFSIKDWTALRYIWASYHSNGHYLPMRDEILFTERQYPYCIGTEQISQKCYLKFRNAYPLQFDSDEKPLEHDVFYLALQGRVGIANERPSPTRKRTHDWLVKDGYRVVHIRNSTGAVAAAENDDLFEVPRPVWPAGHRMQQH